MNKKNRLVKIMAFLALFGITVGIVGTGILFLLSKGNSSTNEQTITPEEYLKLQEMVNSQSGNTLENNTGVLNTESLEGNSKNGSVEKVN